MNRAVPLSTTPERMPQLDGLRALAVGAVLVEHFRRPDAGLGELGVRLFFVISGLLITEIILKYKASGEPLWPSFANFMQRRLLRLYPVLVIAVIAGVLLDLGEMRRLWLVSLLYLNNFQIVIENRINLSGHLWSLAAEQQFYLLWFFVIVLCPRAHLRRLLIACVLSSIAYRICFWFVSVEYRFASDALIPGVMDSLALGALAGLTGDVPPGRRRGWAALTLLAACATLAFPVVVIVRHAAIPETGPLNLLYTLSINTLSFLIVALAASRSAALKPVLENPLLLYVGKVSYGLYVYHVFVGQWVARHGDLLPFSKSSPLYPALLTLLSLTLASASYEWIEKPILRRRRLLHAEKPAVGEPVPAQ